MPIPKLEIYEKQELYIMIGMIHFNFFILGIFGHVTWTLFNNFVNNSFPKTHGEYSSLINVSLHLNI